MQITNRGMMVLSISFSRGGEMGSADERARILVERLNAKRQRTEAAADRVAVNRNVIAEQMPSVWQSLIKAFEEYCDSINKHEPEAKLRVYQLGVHDFIVRPGASAEIVTGHYSADTKKVSVRTAGGIEWYTPSVYQLGAGEVRLVSNSTNQGISVDSIAQNTIDDVLMRD